MVKRKIVKRKYKVSGYVRGKLRVVTIVAPNKITARKRANKKWGKAADVGYTAAERV